MYRHVAGRVILALALIFSGVAVSAAPFAAMVIDARDGRVLYARNADTRLYPASLTKMMTLYITFESIRDGKISLDQKVTISKHAAAEPPSKLGLRAGERITIRYLIRAAAIKSANDAATALAEAVEGSVPAFARRMNRTAKALGMTRTTFKNANGLTKAGHLSTARDMTTMGRHLFFDFPQYYNLFSRRSETAGGRKIHNTNRKFLAAYKGADGIKTGYTQAAGFNLVASAKRGQKRVIGAIFGERSVTMRNKKMAELLDIGFKRAPRQASVIPPLMPRYGVSRTALVTSAVSQSPRPRARPVLISSAAKDAIAAALALATTDNTASRLDASQSIPRSQAREDGLVVVTRMSTSGGRQWSISLGVFAARTDAEKLLIKTALQDFVSLDGALRKVAPRGGKYEANFVGLSQKMAARACSRLKARRQECATLGPDG